MFGFKVALPSPIPVSVTDVKATWPKYGGKCKPEPMPASFHIRDNKTRKFISGNWAKFVTAVEESARKSPLRGARAGHPASLANLRSHQCRIDQLLNVTRRCQQIKYDRSRCKCWAMLGGATRCHHHGGYRETPNNLATKRALSIGLLYQMTANRAARRTLAKMNTTEDTVAKREAREALRIQGHTRQINDAVLTGACAFQRNDAGKSWRSWLRDIRARKTKRG